MKEVELKKNLEKIRDTLSKSNGNVSNEVVQQIKDLMNNTNQQQNKSVLTNIKNSISSKDIMSQVSQIQNSDVVNRSIEKTLNSMLDPMKIVFVREMSRYVDAISADKKIYKDIPRTIAKKNIKKLEDGVFKPSATGAEGDEMVINPDFKQLLATGYKPKDIEEYENKRDELFPFFKEAKDKKEPPPEDSNPFTNLLVTIAEPEIGDPNSDYIKNFLGGTEPGERVEKISTVVPKYGSIFIDSFDIKSEQINYLQTNTFSQVSLKGELKTNIEAKKYLSTSLQNLTPNWNINYKEQGNKYFLTIKNNYTYSKKSGLLPNSYIYRFVGNTNDSGLNNNTKNKLDDINKGDKCNVQSNEELFSFILSNKLDGLVEDRNPANLTDNEKSEFIARLKSNHSSLINSYIQELFDSVTNNRLLQKFKTTILPGTGLDESDLEKNNLILLNLINFIPETSDELKACGKSLHPLNIDEVVKLMKIKFENIGLQTFDINECNPDDEPKNAITEASSLGSSLLLIRMSVFEYILKNLFVFDELGYSKTLTQSSLIKEYVSLILKKDLEDLGIYEQVEEVIEDSFNLLKENGIIKPEDENITEVFSSIVNNSSYETPSENMKILINAMFRKTMNYVKKLLGAKTEESRTELDILTNKVYHLNNFANISDPNSNVSINVFSLLKNKTSNISRFDDKNRNSNSFFILEKFMNIKDLTQKEQNLSFYDFALFVSRLLQTSNMQASQVLNNKIKICLKMSLVLKSNRNHTISSINLNNRDQILNENYLLNNFLNDTKNYFYYNNSGGRVQIKNEAVSRQKSYVFYDYDKQTKTLNHYNSIPVEQHEIELSLSDIISRGNSEKEIFSSLNEQFLIKKQELIDSLSQKVDYQILIKKTMMSDKIINLLSFYSNSALSTEEIESLFKKSKSKLKEIMMAGKNINNYAYQNETDLRGGNVAAYQADFQNTGNPNGGIGLDLLQFLVTTPILILKGITQVMDPNISIASQIVNAAAAGLLFPKLDEQGNIVAYPGDPFILPTVLASMALLPVNVLPPGFGIGPPVTPLPGMLFWALEPLLWKLPFFQNQAAKSSDAKKLKDDPNFRGFNVSSDNFSCDKDQDDI